MPLWPQDDGLVIGLPRAAVHGELRPGHAGEIVGRGQRHCDVGVVPALSVWRGTLFERRHRCNAILSSTSANTVPPRSVMAGMLVLSSVTVNLPPDVVPSKLSVVFLSGTAPPEPITSTHAVPLQYRSRRPAPPIR